MMDSGPGAGARMGFWRGAGSGGKRRREAGMSASGANQGGMCEQE